MSKILGHGATCKWSRFKTPLLFFFFFGSPSVISSSTAGLSPGPISSNQSSIVAPSAKGGFLSFFALVYFTSPFLLPPRDVEGSTKGDWYSGCSKTVASPLFHPCLAEVTVLTNEQQYISPQQFYATIERMRRSHSSANNGRGYLEWNWFGHICTFVNGYYPQLKSYWPKQRVD